MFKYSAAKKEMLQADLDQVFEKTCDKLKEEVNCIDLYWINRMGGS